MTNRPEETRTSYDVAVRGPLAIVTIEHVVDCLAAGPTAGPFGFMTPDGAVILDEDTRYVPGKGNGLLPRIVREEEFPGVVSVFVTGAAKGSSVTCRMRYAVPISFLPDAQVVVPTKAAHVISPWATQEDPVVGTQADVTATVQGGATGAHVASERIAEGRYLVDTPIVVKISGFRPFPVQGVTPAGHPVDVSIDPPGRTEHPADVEVVAFGLSMEGARTVDEAGLRSALKDADAGRDLLVVTGCPTGFGRGVATARRVHVLMTGPAYSDADFLAAAVASKGTVAACAPDDVAAGTAFLMQAASRPRASVTRRNGGRGATKALIRTDGAVLDILISPETTAALPEDVGTYVEKVMAAA